MPTPPPTVWLAVATIPVGLALIAWWLYVGIEHDHRIPIITAALLLVSAVGAPVTAQATTPDSRIQHIEDVPVADQNTTTPTPTTTTATNTSTIQQLIEDNTWTREQAQRAIRWVQTHDASQLSQHQRDELHRRLLQWDGNQGGGRQVPESVYRALIGDQATSTPTPTTETPREPTQETTTPTPRGAQTAGNTTTYVAAIDDATRIVSWSYDDGTFTITIESDRPQLITVIQPISSKRGISRFQMGSKMIPEGRSTIRVESAEVRGMALVTLATQRAGITISTGTEALTALGWVSSYFAWFVGSTIGISLVVLAGWYKKRQEAKKPREAKRW